VSLLLIIFALIDFIPYVNKLQFNKNKLPVGGILSGFFGGLSGIQGALRSAFLIKAGLSKQAFIASAAIVSAFVDLTRLSVYAARFLNVGLQENLTLVICASISGTIGTYFGNKLLRKITLKFIQKLVAVMLIIISLALGAGLI
jgi:uncharacterized protein